MFGPIDGEIYPSQGAIAVRAGLCQKTAGKALKKAEALGWIEIHRSFLIPGRSGTRYSLTIPAVISHDMDFAGNDYWAIQAEIIRKHIPNYEAKKLDRNKEVGI